MLKYRLKVHFAHRTFQWSSEARGKAAVADLDAHQWLVHLTKSEDLAKYLEE